MVKDRSNVLTTIFIKGGHVTAPLGLGGNLGREEPQTPNQVVSAAAFPHPHPGQLCHHLSPAAPTPLAIPLTLAHLRHGTPWQGPLRRSFHIETLPACNRPTLYGLNKPALHFIR